MRDSGTETGIERIGNIYGEDRGTGFAGNVWNKNKLSPTITTCMGGGREPMIIDVTKEQKSETENEPESR